MPKESIKIDSELLRPCRRIAKILGIPLEDFIQLELSYIARDIDEISLSEIAERWFVGRSWTTQKKALAAAERLEVVAVEEQLEGREYAGTFTTKVASAAEGGWTIEMDYLRPGKKRWEKVSLEADDDEGEKWKQ